MGWGTGNIVGGSGGLNFKIVGGTSEPSATHENTIWVNTSVAITGYVFSAEAPASPTAGMVWIATGATSPVAFNALKKNGIFVYPNAVKQYVNGVWKNVAAHCYTGEKWVQFSAPTLVIYESGTQYYPMTIDGYTKSGTAPYNKAYSDHATRGSVTFNDSNIYLTVSEVQGGSGGIRYVGTQNSLNLSGYSTLHIKMSSHTHGSQAYLYFAATPTKACPGTNSGGAYKSIASGTTSASIDVSSLDNAYVVVTGTAWDSTKAAVKAYITKIWAE